jgi:16S rRNA (cytosine967-C5)-methyltransferase
LPEENGERIATFAASHADFELSAGGDVIGGSDLADGSKGRLAEAALLLREGIVLTPRRTGTDGFFIAVLKRKK